MSKKKHKKTKSKSLPKIPKVDESKKIKEEINELETKREATKGTGFRGFAQRLAYNKAINDKKKFLKRGRKLENISQQTELVKKQVELEKQRNELRNLRKKQVDFNPIKLEDLS